MLYVTTPLGRMVPQHETGTVFQDLVLKILFDYRMSPFNSANVPLTLSALAKTARADAKEVRAIVESLTRLQPPLVEQSRFQGEDAYSITGNGVVFVQNIPPGMASVP
jgi:hypothetical protein